MQFPTPPKQPEVEEISRTPLEQSVIDALKTVYDPEIPVDIVELGLIYAVDLDEATGRVKIDMTLTAPGCPVAGVMPEWVHNAIIAVDGVESVEVNMVWEPMWTVDNMSMRARIELNML